MEGCVQPARPPSIRTPRQFLGQVLDAGGAVNLATLEDAVCNLFCSFSHDLQLSLNRTIFITANHPKISSVTFMVDPATST